ncbi:MAG: hypothetical protein FWD53_04795, partial [Phycisphaerales bacterium]|nr:hypothetical protein [Phycisphaerales bacterium]
KNLFVLGENYFTNLGREGEEGRGKGFHEGGGCGGGGGGGESTFAAHNGRTGTARSRMMNAVRNVE